MSGVFLGKETSAGELVPGSQTRLEMVPSMSSHRGSPIPKQALSELVYPAYLSSQESGPASPSLPRVYQSREKQ